MAYILEDRIAETSTSTGTGSFTLAGAITGYKAFSSVCANNDTLPYVIQAVDGSGVPSGEWETGLGTWTTGGILLRTTVFRSSNSNTLVTFSAGSKQVFLTLLSTDVKTGAFNSSPPQVDLTGASSDYTLALGQTGFRDFTNVTNLPLFVVSGDNQMFKVELVPDLQINIAGANTLLYPNNNQALGAVITRDVIFGSQTTPVAAVVSSDAFVLDGGGVSWGATLTISTRTKHKRCTSLGRSTSNSTHFIVLETGTWNDPSTIWNSLGTIVFANPTSGRVYITKILDSNAGGNIPQSLLTSGSAVLDFSTGNIATTTVTGTGWVLPTSKIIVNIDSSSTSTHSEDEHMMLSKTIGLSVPRSQIVTGSSFKIIGTVEDKSLLGGTINVNWIAT